MKSESRIQQECVKWYRNTYCLTHHNPRGIIFSVPNEGRNQTEQLMKIQTGLMSGVSDLIVITPLGRLLFIECKDDKGRQSDKQKDFEHQVTQHGYNYHLIRSLDEFQEIIAKSLL